MKQLRSYALGGIFFVLTAGTLSHFLYEWSGNHFIAGLFSPVNESTWEHMKLIFFPMLLYSLIVIPILRPNWPGIIPALMSGTLAGTLSIPVIFYTYTGILGRNLFLLDFMTFAAGVVLAIGLSYKLTLSGKARDHLFLLSVLTIFFILSFWLFTFRPPDLGLFAAPNLPEKI